MNTKIIMEEYALNVKANYTDDRVKVTFNDLRKAEIGSQWHIQDYDAPYNVKWEYTEMYTVVYKNETGCCVCRQLNSKGIHDVDDECIETELIWFQFA